MIIMLKITFGDITWILMADLTESCWERGDDTKVAITIGKKIMVFVS